jgi:DNA repair protein RadC
MPLSIVEEEDGRIAVSSPYHPNFPARARSLGGIWNAARRVWVFDAADHDRVRSLCREIYGTDGQEHGSPLPNAPPLAGEGRVRAPFPNAVSPGRNEFAEAVTAVPHYYGHRRRLRERMIAAGAENLPDYELLEMLLFAANPQGDVKPAAKSLLAHFGGFGKVMSADPEALSEAGLGLAGIAAIKSVREAALRLMRFELQEQPVVNSWDKLIDYCNAQVAHNKVEEFHILFLDRKNVLIKHERQQRGTVDHTPVYPREVVKRALDLGAAALILVHNHPSGDPTPSKADIAVTQDIKKAAAPLGVVLHDHVIIGRNGHTSLRDLGLI